MALKREEKDLTKETPPSYTSELLLFTANLLFVKMYSASNFEALTFFLLALPMLVYIIGTLFINLMQLI